MPVPAQGEKVVQRFIGIIVGFMILVIFGAMGCTPEELDEWVAWHARDPEAAIASLPKLRNRQGDQVWNKIARCESDGRWDYPPITNRSGTYSGGLMIGHRWWAPLGGREFAEWPYLATRAEQIHVAEKIVDAQGLDRGWQCWP